MVFWLVLIAIGASGSSPAMLHVGNFKSDQTCQAAAQAASIARASKDAPQPMFICVQANEAGSLPPVN